ncbi:TonB-dependent receptor plug domain-containing protein [Ideonella sp. BN130291]|uniref:TonB-dependent receptor plug domain-containing protein n=1 Tax=Ideonella sp. BN130291 TaxID=3112940 RepID=UPI002E25F627|nr:TonB-dependent receptor [Ideonella sp. BN130291]
MGEPFRAPACPVPLRRAVVALAWACAAMAPVFAATPTDPERAEQLAALPLDALLDMEVTGASKFSQRMSETAASVTVITAAEMRALGYRSLADVLRSVRGLMVTNDRSYSYLGVRGFYAPGDYNTRVLLLVDGYRTNDVVYDQAYIGGEFPLDFDLVDRVEFVPGQGSAVYGANALFGVINVITRKPGGAGTDGAALSLGSAGLRELRVGDSRVLADGTALQWSASRRLVRGTEVVLPEGVATAGDYERRSSVYLRVLSGEVSASALHAERLKGAPALLDTIAGDPRTNNRDEHSMLDLSWRHALGQHDELTARWFIGHYRFEGRYAYDYPPVTVAADDVTGQWWGLEARWFSTRWQDHKLVLGSELQVATHLRQKTFDVDPAVTYLDDRRSAHRVGLFMEDQVELSPAWSFTAGARWDHNKGYRGQFSPRVALVWRPQDELVLKLIRGSAFRVPNAFEAYYQVDTVGGYKLNPALTPERVTGTELALEWRPTVHDRVSLSLFDNRARNLVVQTLDPADELFVFQNLGSAHARGLEAEFERAWSGGARLRANLTLQTVRDSASVMPLAAYAPRRMGKLAAIVPLGGDWSAGLEWQGVPRRGGAAGYGVNNLTVSRALPLHGWSVSASVFDLFDRYRTDPGTDLERQPTIAQPGRTVTLRLDLVF